MELLASLATLAVIGLPGPLVLAVLAPHLFAPRGSQFAGIALYGGAWVIAKTWLEISPSFVF
jgi:hypothetical protein